MIVFDDGSTQKNDESSKFNKNTMQLIYSIGHMFNYVDTYVFQTTSYKTCHAMNFNVPFKIPRVPVLTRWWTVGDCAVDLIQRWDIWHQVLSNLSKVSSSDITLATSKVIKDAGDLLSIPEIRWDVHFFAEIHLNWIAPHFSFLHRGDPVLKEKEEYQNRLIGVRYYIMVSDILKYRYGKWKESEKFKQSYKYMKIHLPPHKLSKIERKVENSFRIITGILHQHFLPWLNHLSYFSVFGDKETATIILRHMLDYEIHIADDSRFYFSETQKREIYLLEFYDFVRSTCKKYDLTILSGLPLDPILEGRNIWNDDELSSNSVKILKHFYLTKFSGACSSTHTTERAVKNANKCHTSLRNETLTSEYSINRWTHWKEASNLEIGYHEDTGLTKRRKCILDESQSMRFKASAMAMIDVVDNLSETEIDKGIEYSHYMTENEYSFVKTRNKNIIDNLTNLFLIDVIPMSNEEPDDTPLVLGLVRYSNTKSKAYHCHRKRTNSPPRSTDYQREKKLVEATESTES